MSDQPLFADLGLPPAILQAIESVGYETPSPIQAACIPHLIEGKDLLGQAQTGTGKTAAFALPLLSQVQGQLRAPQLLVLTPTRELAIQVAEAIQQYAHFIKNFHILPIYGGQGFTHQLKQLKRGVQVIVGTPGRVMDHMRRGTLKLDELRALVLDEADEMLRMGFIDDVEWVLEQTPDEAQIALFSATMPKPIQRVAENYLTDPEIIKIESKTTTVETIRQRYWHVGRLHKLDAMSRILEGEDFDGVIVFVRTKTATIEIADKLAARGFAATALNGDIAQNHREAIVDKLKQGKTDILVATDVVARGLDVPRISLVINYDIPYDTESYVHRIGRTGRAGREGDAILFVSNREKRLLRAIEKATGQKIEEMQLPSVKSINEGRINKFKQSIIDALESDQDLSLFEQLIQEIGNETDFSNERIAAALACMNQGGNPLLLKEEPKNSPRDQKRDRDRKPWEPGEGHGKGDNGGKVKAMPLKEFPDIKMQRFRISVGYDHGVKPGNIVGAIANEAELESKYIGHIEIYDGYSTVDLPADMPEETFNDLKNVWVCKRQLGIELLDKQPAPSRSRKRKKPVNKGGKKRKQRSRKKD